MVGWRIRVPAAFALWNNGNALHPTSEPMRDNGMSYFVDGDGPNIGGMAVIRWHHDR